ncbi:MAG: hydantoinase/oxoprolinase family protein [Candidatus Bathyarchaeia archaeon]
MVKVLGWDIGGANIKVAYMESKNNELLKVEVFSEYFPIWKKGKERLKDALEFLKLKTRCLNPDLVNLTMTIELSDVYFSKKEGVNHVLETIKEVFPNEEIKVLDVDGNLLSIEKARENYLEVAAANWYATGWLASKLSKDCLAVDVGSTTTSIIPVLNGKVAAKGKNDLEKLAFGELVYTGALRTNVATIVSYIPLRGFLIPVSSEFFSQSGDVHLVLGNLKPEDYSVDTPDGRGVSIIEASARIARVLCADLDMLSLDEIKSIANYIYEAQLNQILNGLKKLLKNFKFDLKTNLAYITGIGREFLALKALEKAGFNLIKDLSDFIGVMGAKATPSFALALMGIEFLEGEPINWKQF